MPKKPAPKPSSKAKTPAKRKSARKQPTEPRTSPLDKGSDAPTDPAPATPATPPTEDGWMKAKRLEREDKERRRRARAAELNAALSEIGGIPSPDVEPVAEPAPVADNLQAELVAKVRAKLGPTGSYRLGTRGAAPAEPLGTPGTPKAEPEPPAEPPAWPTTQPEPDHRSVVGDHGDHGGDVSPTLNTGANKEEGAAAVADATGAEIRDTPPLSDLAPYGYLDAPFHNIPRPIPLPELRKKYRTHGMKAHQLEPYTITILEMFKIDPEVSVRVVAAHLGLSRNMAHKVRGFALAHDSADWEAAKKFTARQDLYEEAEELFDICLDRLRADEHLAPQEVSTLVNAALKAGARRAALLGLDKKAEAPTLNLQVINAGREITPLEALEDYGLTLEAIEAAADQLALALSSPRPQPKAQRARGARVLDVKPVAVEVVDTVDPTAIQDNQAPESDPGPVDPTAPLDHGPTP